MTETTVNITTQQKTGVHWGWWVFWLILFWPALFVVALIHFGRKDAAKNIVSTTIYGDEDDQEIARLRKEIEKKKLEKELAEMDNN